jgi:sigma-B regulation protein RsbQ
MSGAMLERLEVSASLPPAEVLTRNNVRVLGRPGGRPMVFVHGFACDQRMWRHMTPAFEDQFRIVLLDQVGAGESDVTAYDVLRHGRLDGYAQDLVQVAEALELHDAIVVGHSVGAMVAVLAHLLAPQRLTALALVGPSARYVDDPSDGYVGGSALADVEDLLATLEANFTGWSSMMAPALMGTPDRPELGQELADTFCGTDPEIAARWGRVTFMADIRAQLADVRAPALVLQCTADPIVPDATGRWMADQLPAGQFVQLRATGHCPHLSAPAETGEALRAFVRGLG